MKPPWSPGVDSIASQCSASVPLLLPIACEYSHMISGCRWRAGRGVGDDRRERRVHRADDVADALVARPVEADRALVVERPGRVVAPDPGRRGVVVRAVARLVAERPGDDRRVVLVALDHPRHAVDPRAEVARVVAQRALEGVRLDVGLVDHVQPELVGQVEERRVVRVVRRPHRVEAELLHLDEVGAHRLGRDHPTGVLVEVVAVDAPDAGRAAPLTSRSTPRTSTRRKPTRSSTSSATVAGRREQTDRQGIERRDLGRPGLDAGDLERATRRSLRAAAGAGGRGPASRSAPLGDASVAADDVPGHQTRSRVPSRTSSSRRPAAGLGTQSTSSPPRRAGPRPSSRLRARCRRTPTRTSRSSVPVRQVVRQAGDRPDVGEIDRPGRVQEDRPRDPAMPPLVLVLDVGRVRPLHDAQRQRVRARPDDIGEVELGGEVGVLARARPRRR